MSKNILRDDIEYVVHCDSDGVIIGPLSKIHAHLEGVRPVLTHFSTWSMIYNPVRGMYGIQLKNPKKDDKQSAGKWDMGVAGHNCYIKENGNYRPLDFPENLVKEAKEEIGISLQMFESQGEFLHAILAPLKKPIGYIFERFHYKTSTNNEWVGLGLIITSNTDVHFEDDEVVDFKWLTPKELKEFIMMNKNCCETLLIAFEKAEKFRKVTTI